jgi:hypothetical protein
MRERWREAGTLTKYAHSGFSLSLSLSLSLKGTCWERDAEDLGSGVLRFRTVVAVVIVQQEYVFCIH